jgi:hypothetical protein
MMAADICCLEEQRLFKIMSLCNTVAKIVNEFAGDIASQLTEKYTNVVAYSSAIDESTDSEGIAQQLAVLIELVNEDFELVEEILELLPMKGKTGADEIIF